MGASFVAAAALPLFGVMPLAQATSGHGQAVGSSHGQVSNHVRAMVRAQGGQPPAAKPAHRQAAKPAAQHPAAKPAQHQAAKPAQRQAVKPVAGHAPAAQKLANVQRQPLKGHGQAKVVVCHATNSDTNPYVVIVVSVSSVKYQGHLAHKTTPNKTWKHTTIWNHTTHPAGSAKPDFIGAVGGSRADMAFCSARGTSPTPKPTASTTTTTPSSTTTTTPSVTTTTPGSTVSGTKTTAPSGTKTTGPGASHTPPAKVLPTKFTNSPTQAGSATTTDDTQVLGSKVAALPRTGANMMTAAAISLMLLLVGGLLLRLSTVRRRRTH